MFTRRTDLIAFNPPELHYGIAIADLDGDGACEAFVCGYGYPNKVLKWNGSRLVDRASPLLADAERHALAAAAGDLNGDGQEELFVLNTDTFAGRKTQPDRLFSRQGTNWTDLLSTASLAVPAAASSGRSVGVIDRLGTGRYGVFVASYGGPLRYLEWHDGGLQDLAEEVGLHRRAGGRGVVAGPLLSDGMDLFQVNEHGPNFFFRNRGDGTFAEVARELGLADANENGRGVALLDDPRADDFALAWGNWEGLHRLAVRQPAGTYRDEASPAWALPSRIRTVLAADFDNDGFQEVFFNNLGEPNRLFGWRDGRWSPLPIGDALEPAGLGTGAAVADFDGDGRLELLVSHGESDAQPLSLYHGPDTGNHWLRVMPLTAAGAPARGALVTLRAGGRVQRRVIDAGSGYLCQMEPVAHFGLGSHRQIDTVTVRWLDGRREILSAPPCDRLLLVRHPG